MVSSIVYTVKEGDSKAFPKASSKHSKSGEYEGMVTTRRTTDILFFILIFAMWICMSIVGGIAVRDGNPYRLIAPIDESGSLCGISASVKNMGKFYTVTAQGVGKCVATCPSRTALPTSQDPNDYICLKWVDDDIARQSGGFQNATKISYINTACFSGGIFNPFTSPIDLSACGCMLVQPTHPVFNRCIYDSQENKNKFSSQSVPNYFVDFMANIIVARYIIFAFGFLLAIAASFFYSHLLRYEVIGQCVCWTSLTMIFIMMIVLVVLCWYTAGQWANEDPKVHGTNSIRALQAFSIIMVVFSLLFLCAMIFLRKSVNLAIKAIALAASAIERMPLIMATPLIQVTGMILFMIPLIMYGLNIASAGTFTVKKAEYPPGSKTFYPSGVSYTLDDTKAQEELWFLTFCMFWTLNFICGIGSLMIAIAVSKWYFTKPTERSEQINSMTVIRAYAIVFRFHLGTAAFGGLIIAFVQMLRAIALYVEKHFKAVQTYNCLFRAAFCCVDCCLFCLEKCLKFITKNAYIQTAIHGSSFCTACKDAFFTIARNIFTVGAVSVVSGLALFIGKIWVMVLAGISGYYFMQGQLNDKLTDFIAPTVLIMAIAYITASIFMDVFHMAIDTAIMCFITDEEQNGKAVYSDPAMADFLHDNGRLDASHKRIEEGQEAPLSKPKYTVEAKAPADKDKAVASRRNEI